MESIVPILSKRLKLYIDQKHSGNKSQAAHFLGFDYSIVYRLYNNDHKSISFFAAYHFLRQISPDDFQLILGEYFPDEMRSLAVIAKELRGDPMVALNQKLDSALKNETSFVVYVLATEGNNITVGDIKEELGNKGLRELNRLVAEGVVIIDEKQILSSYLKSFVRPSQETCKIHAGFNLGKIDFNEPGSKLENLFASLSSEGLKKYYNAIVDSIATLKAIMEDTSNRGDILVLSSIFCGRLATKQDG